MNIVWIVIGSVLLAAWGLAAYVYYKNPDLMGDHR